MYLTTETRLLLEKALGKSTFELATMDFDQEKAFIEQKTGKKLTFSKKSDRRQTARGNHLLVNKRIVTMDEIDKRITGLKYDDR